MRPQLRDYRIGLVHQRRRIHPQQSLFELVHKTVDYHHVDVRRPRRARRHHVDIAHRLARTVRAAYRYAKVDQADRATPMR